MNLKSIIAAVFFLFTAYLNSQNHPHFASQPALSPDGQSVYFVYDGDIWQSSVHGGEARRIVSMEGEEISPKPSPDGKHLAFSSNQYGNNDIYILHLQNGEINQLTTHQAPDVVKSWSPDSKTIYFTSNRYNTYGSYAVPAEGGTPITLFDTYFSTSDEIVPSGDGGFIFTDTREVNSQRARKHYKGPNNPDLLYYHPETGEFKKLTHYEGKDFNPTVDNKGNVYFVSDMENGEYNLYTLENGQPKALTHFDSSIKNPYVSANGNKIVFEKDYQLWVYDVENAKSSAINFNAPSYYTLSKEEKFEIKDFDAADVSPDGKKLAFVSRGVLFVSNISGEFIQEIINDGERVKEVKWLSDNENLLITKTLEGYPNLYKVSAKTGEIEELTHEKRSNRALKISPDGKMGVYLSGRDEVRLIDLKKFKSRTIVNDELWAFQNSDPGFSPDGKFVVFSAVRNFEKDIFVHDIAADKTYNMTQTGISEADPYWSPDGRYIYFASNRTEPAYPFGMRDARIYRMALDWYADDFRSEGFEKLWEKEKKGKEKKKEKEIDVKINYEDLKDRIEPVSKRFGSQNNPKVFESEEKTIVFFNSNEDGGKMKLFKRVSEPYKSPKTEKVSDEFIYDILMVDKQFYLFAEKAIYKYNEGSNKAEKIEIKKNFNKNLEQEFRQMFEETWAGIEENFYDESFHGVDWANLKESYASYLPYLRSRNDLRILLNDMLGELNSSHLGFNSKGEEEETRISSFTAETGLLFDAENPYKVSRIVHKSPAMVIAGEIEAGDVLTEVNGVKIDPKNDRSSYFTFPDKRDELRLVFERKGKKKEVNVKTITPDALRNLLYDEWIEENRKNVKDWSGDRIAYSYMKNMGGGELESFLIDMTQKANDRDGLILDLRFNLGGNVHDKVLNFLAQRPYLQWKYREGAITPQSNFGPAAKPIVLLINQGSLSDAEMTSAGFKELGLGKVIGTPTYRWIIFTSSKGLVDGSSFRVPAWGVYTFEGDNLELTGVEPDIRVDNTFKDYLDKNDPQLRRAVDEILKDIN